MPRYFKPTWLDGPATYESNETPWWNGFEKPRQPIPLTTQKIIRSRPKIVFEITSRDPGICNLEYVEPSSEWKIGDGNEVIERISEAELKPREEYEEWKSQSSVSEWESAGPNIKKEPTLSGRIREYAKVWEEMFGEDDKFPVEYDLGDSRWCKEHSKYFPPITIRDHRRMKTTVICQTPPWHIVYTYGKEYAFPAWERCVWGEYLFQWSIHTLQNEPDAQENIKEMTQIYKQLQRDRLNTYDDVTKYVTQQQMDWANKVRSYIKWEWMEKAMLLSMGYQGNMDE